MFDTCHMKIRIESNSFILPERESKKEKLMMKRERDYKREKGGNKKRKGEMKREMTEG